MKSPEHEAEDSAALHQLVVRIIDEAVQCWHEVADDHDIKQCNCFREKFVQRLIDLGLFEGRHEAG